MTQEQKELLFKDLCARLPYKVKISIPELFTNKEQIKTFNEIFKGVDDLYRVNDSGVRIEYIKPYLFPLSSMTGEQYDQLYIDSRVKNDSIDILDALANDMDAIDWLNKNHFDYRGLIEKGLAIDATGLNIY